MVAWLSSIKEKDLNYCGKFVLTGDMSELSITKVDLSNMNTLEGKLSCCLKASPKECSRKFLQSHHYHMHLPPLHFKATLTPSRTAPSHRCTSPTA